MAVRTARYHSRDERDPRVYHDYRDCPNGQQIDPKNRVGNDGGLPRCGNCKRMD